jgi:hypothetical protein
MKMKKNLVMSLVAVGLLTSVNAADDLSSMFKDGKVSGQIREFSILRNTNYSDTTTADFSREANTIGGYLKFDTADFKGLSLGAAFYTTNGFALPGNSAHIDPTLLGTNKSSYSLLGEAYVQYKYGKTTFKGGRQKLDTPLAGSDDARMLPSLFEAYVLTNTDIANTTLVAAHVTQFAAGTFANGYDGGVIAATSGYSALAGNTAKYQGKFTNMGTWALGDGKETKGVSTAAAVYANGSLKAQVWDYYAYDILNAVYGEVSVGWSCLLTDKIKPSLSAQMIKENAVGERFAGDVNSFYAAGKFNVAVGDASAYVAYSEQSKADSTSAATALDKATITPWGGMPAYTQGMVTRHQFIAGTKATKVAGSYDFKNMGANVIASAFYTSFDMDKNSGSGSVRTATEPGFDLAFKPEAVKNLELKFRGNFPRQYSDNTDGTKSRDWDEYRFIANYNF